MKESSLTLKGALPVFGFSRVEPMGAGLDAEPTGAVVWPLAAAI
jgi:hypothetical protein